jgi:hypothetical protein
MTRRLVADALVLAVLVCVLGCRNADPGDAVPPDAPEVSTEAVAAAPSACDLLTAADLREVLGVTATETVAEGSRCAYRVSATDDDEAVATVHLEFGDVRPLALLAQYQATLRSTLGEYESLPVHGIGDAASWDGTALAATLSVGPDRSAFVTIQLPDEALDVETRLSRSRELMRRAIDRLRDS